MVDERGWDGSRRRTSYLNIVMAGLVPAIHALLCVTKNLDALDI